MYRPSYCNVHINQRDAQNLVNNLYFFVKWLYMFRTIISSSSGVAFNKLYSAIGTFVLARRTGTNVPIALYSLLNVAPGDELMIVRNRQSHLTKK